MKQEWVGIRAMREFIVDKPGLEVQLADKLESEIADWKLCLAGNPASEKWKLLEIELTNKEVELLHRRRRIAGRTPQMESWADPLPR
jgi:hypothetical protein